MPDLDPVESLLQSTAVYRERDTLKVALAAMDDETRESWIAVLDGDRINPKTRRPYGAEHITKALRAAGHEVSSAAVKRWRSNRTL